MCWIYRKSDSTQLTLDIASYEDADEYKKKIKLDSGVPAYIYYEGGYADDGSEIEKIAIEAYIEHKGHMLRLTLMNDDGEITKEQEKEFVKILNSIELK